LFTSCHETWCSPSLLWDALSTSSTGRVVGWPNESSLLCAFLRVESSSIPRIAVCTLTDWAAAKRSLNGASLGDLGSEGEAVDEGGDANVSPFGHPNANRPTAISAVASTDRRITDYSCSLHFKLGPSAREILKRQRAQLEGPASQTAQGRTGNDRRMAR